MQIYIYVFELIIFLFYISPSFCSSRLGKGFQSSIGIIRAEAMDITLYVESSSQIVKRGEHVAPIPKKTPVKMTQNSGLFFSKSLIIKLMPITLQEMKENPDRKSMMVKLIQLRLKLHRKRETEMMQV